MKNMHILMTGATGFIGSVLCERLIEDGHRLTIVTRRSIDDTDRCHYLKDVESVDSNQEFDAVINLAGASLAGQRWTPAYKREIVSSRVDTTQALLQLLERLQVKPGVLLSASAIGYYGHHGDEKLNESGPAEPGFSQALCEQWERLALEAEQHGVRVCILRFGIVLDKQGGAFERMAQSFKIGIGSWLGTGNQWLSWVHRQDVIRATSFLLQQSELRGAFNVTAPHPVTSRAFCEAMRRHKPTFLSMPVPSIFLRLLLGEMADELLLNGQRVLPVALVGAGFSFEFPEIDLALESIL